MKVWVGIDDTDSVNGMCTTYLALLAMDKVEKFGRVVGFPRLIRLNPTIPYKTRGNGAVAFLVETDDVENVIEVVDDVIIEHSMMSDDSTNPGAVFVNFENDRLMSHLTKFARKAVRDIVSLDEALFIIGKYFIPHLKYKKGRGLIGALSAVGYDGHDYTYELLAYRMPERFGTPRGIDEDSFYEADELYYPKIWDTVDWRNRIVVCVPKGKDPVLYGIRGSDYNAINSAVEILRTEEVDRKMMFITNQSTDAHLIDEDEVNEVKNFHSYIIRGTVVQKPYIHKGGHVFFTIKTKFGEVKCSAFEPTKQFRDVVLKLIEGDEVRVFGAMKKNTINLEKMEVIKLVRFRYSNPKCPICGKRMKSSGRNKPFRCKNCKTTAESRVKEKIDRDLSEGFYEVPPCARGHISKPLVRMDVPNKNIFR
ncbi:tRNA(Ile2) 2-agmatinylcytidine synthetase [Archaeoglobus sulfaticallidus PM70-1]|uniref:tRNA(Ile2) 2-agmatinylcytidine synthetase TiaS n=1 Tax=Archaeoglobus sulfaticallidus PM70-1 TaxID=387631 RepID=N0BKJ5_9EURY|nr:tRNA(Ile)(2)-agmatinylcytidine synthase [Archaeoglobus sulfaticallidus]AGK61011.1 tRNA(Ile2) 2-agmatinylcytidine synthetase [Archaeoglobus sulfaticallidus PM70-1]